MRSDEVAEGDRMIGGDKKTQATVAALILWVWLKERADKMQKAAIASPDNEAKVE